MRRPAGFLNRPEGFMRRPAGFLRRPAGFMRRPQGVRRRPNGPRIANNGTTNRTKTITFVLPLWIFFCFIFNKLSWVGLGHLARGVKLPPARGLGSRAIHLTRTHRPRIANNETTNRTKTINFVLPLWIFFCFILTRSPWQPNNT